MSSRANKVPTDLGVLGIEATKAALNALKGPPSALAQPAMQFKDDAEYSVKTWGQESAEEVAQKALKSALARQNTTDIYSMLKYVLKQMVKMILIQRLLKKTFDVLNFQALSNSFSWMAVLSFQAWQFGAGRKLNTTLPDPSFIRLPLLGHLIPLALSKFRLHNFLFETVTACNFQSVEVSLPGMYFMGLMDARDREYALKTNFRNYLKNRENDSASFEYIFAELMGRGIFAVDKREWQDARKVASHMFSGASLKEKMEQVFNKHADYFVSCLEEVSNRENNVLDIQEAFQSSVFDGFCEIAFGVDTGALHAQMKDGRKPQFLISFDACQCHSTERVLLPPLLWHFQRLFAHFTGLGEEAEYMKNLKVLVDYVDPIILARLNDANVEDKQDLLSLYIKHAKSTQQLYMLEVDFLRDVIINFMIAGRDTTSCTLSYMMKFLGENEAVRLRVMKEAVIDRKYITLDDTKTVPFADAVFNEVIRMAPPVANDIRVCVGDDVLPSGIKMKDGSRIIISNLAVGRDEFLWKNAHQFEPERWMAYDQDGVALPVKRPDEYVLPVFWAGKRLCLGKDMARFEAIVFLSKIFERVRVLPLPNQSEEMVSGPVMFRRHGILCKIAKREDI